MFSAIRRRLHLSPATVIAGLALVFAMTGGAYAAKKYLITSTKQISPSVLKQLQGKAGKAGAPGAAGAQGAQGPAGPAGPAGSGGGKGETGPAGTKGEKGATGATGAKGVTGATGTTGFTKTLPKGETETGTWVISGSSTNEGLQSETEISFPIPLAQAGASGSAFGFTEEQTSKKEFGSSGCSGTVAKPTAPPGVLCVYTAFENNHNVIAYRALKTPDDVEGGYGISGAVVTGGLYEPTETEPAQIEVWGSWAITAP